MVTKEEFLTCVRNGWKRVPFGRGQLLNYEGGSCALGAYMRGKGYKVHKSEHSALPFFTEEDVASMMAEVPIAKRVMEINDDWSYAHVPGEEAKKSIISRLEALPW